MHRRRAQRHLTCSPSSRCTKIGLAHEDAHASLMLYRRRAALIRSILVERRLGGRGASCGKRELVGGDLGGASLKGRARLLCIASTRGTRAPGRTSGEESRGSPLRGAGASAQSADAAASARLRLRRAAFADPFLETYLPVWLRDDGDDTVPGTFKTGGKVGAESSPARPTRLPYPNHPIGPNRAPKRRR